MNSTIQRIPTANAVIKITLLLTLIASTGRTQDSWVQKSDFTGYREGATGFSIDDKGYFGTGLWYFSATIVFYYKDFWEYDPESDTWTQKADMAGGWRANAVGFSIAGKGYIGTGYNYSSGGEISYWYKDFWEYDPVSNTWTQKADFGGNVRSKAAGFSIDGKGYLGTGYFFDDDYYYSYFFNDFWEYDPAGDTWTQKADFTGVARMSATSFSISGKGYFGTGISYDPYTLYNDFWEYNPDFDSWTEKASFAGTPRAQALGFSIDGKGYIGTGFDENEPTNDFWEYNPVSDKWLAKADFGGSDRYGASGFSIGNKGYIGIGAGFQDFWEYTPDEEVLNCNIPTNPLSNNITSSTSTLKWDAISGAMGYKVRYKIAATSEWLTTRSTHNSKTLSGLAASTEYVWEVKSICDVQPLVLSEWSEKQFFTTAPLRLAGEYPSEEFIQEMMVEVYPNPISTTAIISFFVNKDAHAVIELFDLAGRKLQSIMNENLSAGNHEVVLQRGELSAGIYLLEVAIDDKSEVKKLIIE